MQNPFINFSWIVEGLLAASEYPDNEEKLKFLRDNKIKSIVTLSEKPIPSYLIEKYKFRYLHLPVKDFDTPSLGQVKKFIFWIKLMERWETPTLIHCDAGIGRTGTFIAIYFLLKGLTPKESIENLRKKRNFGIESLKQESFIYELSEILPYILKEEDEENFKIFYETVKTLRKECPWDREQTKESLIKYLNSEVEELKEAILKKDIQNTLEELGDVMLEIMFQIVISEELGEFSINDVFNRVIKKLVNRHPHVFKDELINSPKEVEDRWEEWKRREKL
ncbi:MAG: dual specificity protein phosphatase family protein [Caldisericia bacterium]|nr:dual specificity protein phosphatase family protein [Caldisericia bacterium]